MSLFDKWADQEGDKVYYTQANHVSESLLNKIKRIICESNDEGQTI